MKFCERHQEEHRKYGDSVRCASCLKEKMNERRKQVLAGTWSPPSKQELLVDARTLGRYVRAWVGSHEAEHPRLDSFNAGAVTALTGFQALAEAANLAGVEVSIWMIQSVANGRLATVPLDTADALLCAIERTDLLHTELVPFTRAEYEKEAA